VSAVLTEKIRTKVDSAMPTGLSSRSSSRADIVACAIAYPNNFGYKQIEHYLHPEQHTYILEVYIFTTPQRRSVIELNWVSFTSRLDVFCKWLLLDFG
jgi:hypothetical protein